LPAPRRRLADARPQAPKEEVTDPDGQPEGAGGHSAARPLFVTQRKPRVGFFHRGARRECRASAESDPLCYSRAVSARGGKAPNHKSQNPNKNQIPSPKSQTRHCNLVAQAFQPVQRHEDVGLENPSLKSQIPNPTLQPGGTGFPACAATRGCRLGRTKSQIPNPKRLIPSAPSPACAMAPPKPVRPCLSVCARVSRCRSACARRGLSGWRAPLARCRSGACRPGGARAGRPLRGQDMASGRRSPPRRWPMAPGLSLR